VILGRRGQRGGTRLGLALIATACALAGIIGVASAEDATEAGTFGKDGIASSSLGVHFQETGFSSVEARPDGGLVAERDRYVESYLASGALDPAAPPQRVSPYYESFPLAGGKRLVLGNDPAVGVSRLTRLNGDGSVDTSFGGTGSVKVAPEASAAAELASGKILVVGTGAGGTHQIIAWITVELLGPDGSIDRRLGQDGRLTLSRNPFSEAVGRVEIAPTADGGALVSGGRFLLRLGADGSPDPGFGAGGLVDDLPPVAGGRVLSDGSVAAVGSDFGSSKDLLVLRYTAAGRPDPGFGQDGIRRFDLGGEEEAHVAMWAADGSVIVGGSSQPPGSCFRAAGCEEVPILAAFDPGGALDPGFGSGGVLRLTALAGLSEDLTGSGVEALTRRPDGSIAAVGSAPPKRTTAFLAAVSPQGALLPDFGEGGIVRLRRPVPAIQRIIDFAPLAEGKLLAGGTADVGVENVPVLIRYAADGSLDRSFGNGAGYVVVDEGGTAGGFAFDSGQVLMSTPGDYPRNRLLRLRAADGARDPAFGSGGGLLLPKRMFVEDLGFAEDGGAIVLGARDVAGDPRPGVVLRYRPNGRPERGFGQNGRVELQTPAGREVRASALAAAGGGRILVGGVSRNRFALARLLPDGRRDPRFGSGGWALARGDRTAKSVTLSRRGSHIYLAGVVGDGKRLRAVLLRFDARGRLDPGFGRNGRRIALISEAAEPKAILPSRRGVLVVLSRGPKPLLFFGRRGEVRRQPVSSRPRFVSNVRATVSRGRLILGWNAFSQAIRRDTYYLAERPFGGR
jgi:uncharacterized delta-60 repeat protein